MIEFEIDNGPQIDQRIPLQKGRTPRAISMHMLSWLSCIHTLPTISATNRHLRQCCEIPVVAAEVLQELISNLQPVVDGKMDPVFQTFASFEDDIVSVQTHCVHPFLVQSLVWTSIAAICEEI